jgi:trigger factor
MSLTVTTEPMDNRQMALTIEVDQARVDQQLRKAARSLGKQYRIPGFRKGKAPYHIISQYLGVQTLYNEIIDDLGQAVYREALEEVDFEPYAQASLEDIALDPMTYKLLVPLEPEVDLGDYRSVRVEEPPVEVNEEDVTERLESYREQYAGWQDVDRPSQYGDLMNIDVKSVIPADGESEEIVVLDESDWDVTPDEENPMEPAGFDEALLELKTGDDAEFELSWPEDSQSIYAGKTARFNVTVNSIQAYEKPELDDEFAQLVGPDYETLDDLLSDIRDSLKEQAEQEARNDYLEKALDALLEEASLNYPPVVVEDQLDAMMNDYEQRLRQFGIESLRGYFEQTGQDLEEYRENQREDAEKIAQRNLVISEILRAEHIFATDEDFEEKIAEFVGESSEDEETQAQAAALAEMLRNGPGRPMLETQILQEKTLDRVLAIVRGEELPSVEELAALKEEAEAEAAAEAETEEEDESEAKAETDTGASAETELVAEVEADGETEVDEEAEAEIEVDEQD